MEKTSYASGTPSWIDIGVSDMDAAMSFYGGLFGWTFTEENEEGGGYRQALLGGQSVAGFGPQMDPGPPHWTTYISVESAEETSAKVVAAGGQVIAPVMDVMGLGHMAIFSDSIGTFFAVWQPGTFAGAGLVNVPGTLTWNELTVREPDDAKVFYGAVFGWTADDKPMGDFNYTEWLLDGHSIGGMMPMVGPMWPAEIPNHWMVYFGVDDTDAACEKVLELGGSVPVPPFDIPAGRIAVVNDTAGAHFSLIKLAEMG